MRIQRWAGPRNSADLTGKFRLLRSVGVLIVAVVALVVAGVALAGAVSTTDNEGFVNTFTDGTTTTTYTNQACLNGHGVNCNIYLDKRDVWLSGLPDSAALSAGTYFFAVVVPGGQPDPNDAGTKNLSDTFVSPYATGDSNDDGSSIPNGDLWTNREFTVDGNGHITAYSGTHKQSGDKLQVFPYDDTTNNGGVYILAVCKVPSGAGTTTGEGTPGVNPRDCKYDAFKVRESETNTASGLSVLKDATPTFNRKFSWQIDKSVDRTTVTQAAGNATFNYTVTVTPTGHADQDYQVTGTIEATNPNTTFDVSLTAITDAISYDDDSNPATDPVADPNAHCVVTPSSALPITVPKDTVDMTVGTYVCTYYHLDVNNNTVFDTPAAFDEFNTATVSWAEDAANGLAAGSDDFTLPFSFDTSNPSSLIDECVNVTDAVDGGSPGSLGQVCVDKDGALQTPTNLATGVTGTIVPASPAHVDLTYSKQFPVPRFSPPCVQHSNTAVFKATDTNATGQDSQTVNVCGPTATGALTIGFWKNSNGQNLIKYYCRPSGGTYSLEYFLRVTIGGPFVKFHATTITQSTPGFATPLGTSSNICSSLAADVYGVLNGASASDMASMLRAQMLGTALDAYFSGQGWTATKVGSIKPPSTFFTTHSNLGSLQIDLTQICSMIDNLSLGTATCSGALVNVVTCGAFASTPMTVLAVLQYVASQYSTAATPLGFTFYSGNRTKEECAKNTFDAFNNQFVVIVP